MYRYVFFWITLNRYFKWFLEYAGFYIKIVVIKLLKIITGNVDVVCFF